MKLLLNYCLILLIYRHARARTHTLIASKCALVVKNKGHNIFYDGKRKKTVLQCKDYPIIAYLFLNDIKDKEAMFNESTTYLFLDATKIHYILMISKK